MSINIELEEESFVILDKYCNESIRPAQIGAVLSRIIEAWYARAAMEWAKNPKYIPNLSIIPENKTNSVPISDHQSQMFQKTIRALNDKLNIEIDPCSLASWLTRMFIKAYDLKTKSELKRKFGK